MNDDASEAHVMYVKVVEDEGFSKLKVGAGLWARSSRFSLLFFSYS